MAGELYLPSPNIRDSCQAAAEAGDPEAQYALGVLYANLLEVGKFCVKKKLMRLFSLLVWLVVCLPEKNHRPFF